MLRKISFTALLAGIIICCLFSCKHEPYDLTKGNFPAEISQIMVRKCATEGCHDAAGYINAAKLRLDSWDELFKGSSHGAVVVPYSPKYSSLLYYLNLESHSNNDVVAVPTMPYNMPPLTEEEYNTIKNWIENGAPDAAGNVAFASDADTRQKVYATQQGCEDLLAVTDAKTGLVMRYIPIGTTGIPEAAHYVKVSPDGRYAYVCFYSGSVIQKIDTRTDKVVAGLVIGSGNWNVVYLSPDGSKLLVSGMSNGEVKLINTTTMSLIESYNGLFISPHGLAANAAFDTFYVTSQYGNVVYLFNPGVAFEPIIIKGTDEQHGSDSVNTPDPHEAIMSPDYSKLFITCMSTNEVRIINPHTTELTKVINVGRKPLEMAISKKRNLLFVTCEEDGDNKFSNKSRGSVYVIDMTSLEIVHKIYGDFFQPHGITIDEQNDRIYVESRNVSQDGPAPHHSSSCDAKNGWYTIYDLNTLQPFDRIRHEVTPDPYSADVRFK